MGEVKGIVLDASVLVSSDNGADPSLLPGADYVFRKLRYSRIPTAISYDLGLSAPKVYLLQEMAKLYSFDCFVWRTTSADTFVSEVAQTFGISRGSCLYVVSSQKKDLFSKLENCGWLIIISYIEDAVATETSQILSIDKLEKLPLTICTLNKKATCNDIRTVGYLMKPSREEDFAKRGAFPLCPSQNGLIFLPLNYELPIAYQLQQVDAVLHKATDEIISVEMSDSGDFANKLTYTGGMQELQRYIECHLDCCVIDPFDKVQHVLDRLEIQQILLNLENGITNSRCKIRGPHFLKVDNFNEPNLEERLAEVNLSLPNIVKPQVASGVADAHSMAIVFKVEQYKDLNVPLPAVVQEYVDHSSTLFKFYVLGEKVFYAIKKSTPNADVLKNLCEENGLKPLLFDSLKSLPTTKEVQQLGDNDLDLGLATDAANWLRTTLGLTIFGFDVIIQEGTGDHVIVDVNYLPSFKEVPDDVAIPAFWEAIKEKLEVKRRVES